MSTSNICRFLKAVRQFRFEDVGRMSDEVVPINVTGSQMVCYCFFVISNNSCSPIGQYRFQDVGGMNGGIVPKKVRINSMIGSCSHVPSNQSMFYY